MAHKPTPRALQQAAQFLYLYGDLLACWNSFELVLELIVRRELRITFEETSIICSGRAVEVKLNMAIALLARDATNKPGIVALRKARTIAERNAFVHGFLQIENHTGHMLLIRREVKDHHKVFAKSRDVQQMREHCNQFRTAYAAAMAEVNISDEQLAAYSQFLREIALAQEDQGTRRPGSPPNDSTASPTQQANTDSA